MSHIANRTTDVVKRVAQIAHEGVSGTDDLRTWQRLEAAHRACPPFQMLMVTLNPLLLHLAFDVHDLRYDCGEWGG